MGKVGKKRAKTQSAQAESKMLIKLIELSLSERSTLSQSARPNGSLISGAKGFLQGLVGGREGRGE